MGIKGLDRELWSINGCVIDVSIKELVEKYERNVIVVDGFNFYGLYLYPKFDWVYGAFRELVQEIRHFVESFERIGVKLVFFFVEGNLDEGADACGSESWMKRRSEYIDYTRKFFINTSKWKYHLQNIKDGRTYYHTPLNALPVVLFALRNIFNCEVHFVYAGDRNDAVAYFSIHNNCLALLGQDNYYIFYQELPRYLSLKQLNLTKMTTVQYCPEVLARHRNLEGHLYPVFIRDGSPTSDQKDILFELEAKLYECGSKEVVRRKIAEYLGGRKLEKVLNVESLNKETIPEDHIHDFFAHILRYKLRFEYPVFYGPLKEWDLIKMQAQEFYASGHMSKYIEDILMNKTYFNNCILEDFSELPPSSVLYQHLREKLYSVLLTEEPQREVQPDEVSESDVLEIYDDMVSRPGPASIWEIKLFHVGIYEKPHEGRFVLDWHMDHKGCPSKPFAVHFKSALHPGLLQLWCKNNVASNITEEKWQLFASCISDNLQWQLLRLLPPTLVVPTVVLYYLFQVVPSIFKTGSWNFLQAWEVEVFIAQAVMLPKMDANSLSRINIEKLNRRVVNLISFFVYGCHHMRLLIEACGYPISEHDLCVYHYFEGKLFHSFYDRAEWRRNAKNLCSQETSAIFEKMRQIIIPEPLPRF